MKNKRIGFWGCDDTDRNKRRKEVEKYIVQPGDWEKYGANAKEACINFMETGKEINWCRGPALCRICGTWVGSTDNEHNGWVFPGGWEHYIKKHDVIPNKKAFIVDAVKWFTKEIRQ